MAILLHDDGAKQILKDYFAGIITNNPKKFFLRLFTNQFTPGDEDTVDFFREAVGAGYAPIELPLNSWSIIDGDPIATIINETRLFSFSGSLTDYVHIYGYYVTDSDHTIIFSELELTPFTPINNGDTLAIRPAFMLSKGTPT